MVEPAYDDGANTNRRIVSPWRFFGLLLACFGLGIAAYALRDAADGFLVAVSQASVGGLVAGFALTLGASMLGYESFRRAFEGAAGGALRSSRLASLYFSAQLLRHLPGRYFGVAYQIAITRAEVTAGSWVAVNAVHSMAIAGTGLLVGLIVVMSPGPLWVFVLVVAAGASLRWVVSASGGLQAAAAAMGRSHWRLLSSIGTPLASMMDQDRTALWGCIYWAGLSWVVYLLAWASYGAAFPGLGAWEGVRLSAYYALAWFVGFATLVAPSGWGIREATFLAVAKDFSGAVVAYGLVIGRVSLLLNDLVLGGTALLVARYRQARTTGGVS